MKTILSAIIGILLVASPVFAGPPIYGGPGDQSSVAITGGSISGTTNPDLAASLPVFSDANKKLVSKSIADTVSALGLSSAVVYSGVIDCATNPNYPAGNAGEGWIISVAGKIGGASGKVVAAGDLILCNADETAAGDEAAVGSKWYVIQSNIDLGNITITGGSISGTAIRTQTKTISTTPVTLTEAELKNSIIYVTTGASVILLPTATATMDGASVVIEAIAAVAPSIDLTTGTEIIVLDGVALTAGNKVTFDGVAGTAILVKYDATASRWRVRVLSGVAIDGGA